MAEKIRILIADDALIAREGLTHILQNIGDIEVVGTASAVDQVLNLATELLPDVVMVDLNWFGDERAGINLIGDLKARLPGMAIIAITAYEHLLNDAKKAGAGLALGKGSTRQELVSKIRVSDFEARSRRIEFRLTSIIKDRVARGEHSPDELKVLREKLADFRVTLHLLESLDKEYQYRDNPVYAENRRRLLQRIYSIEIDLEFDYPDLPQ